MPSETESDDAFLKRMGIRKKTPAAAPKSAAPPAAPPAEPPTAAPDAAPPTAAPGAAPAKPSVWDEAKRQFSWQGLYENTPLLQIIGGAQRAGLQGMAQTAADVGKLSSHVAPEATEKIAKDTGLTGKVGELEEFASRDPAVPYAPGLGTAAKIAGEYGPTMIPAVGLELLVANTLAKLGLWGTRVATRVPTGPVFRGGQWVQGYTRGSRVVPHKWSARAARGTGAVGGGAAAGAVKDPEDPTGGALGGALSAPLGGVAGSALRTPFARYAAGTLVPIAGAGFAIHMLSGGKEGLATELAGATAGGKVAHSMAHWIAANTRWHSSPVGRILTLVGRNLVDQTGNLVGTLRVPLAGYAASTVGPWARENAPEFGSYLAELARRQSNAQQAQP